MPFQSEKQRRFLHANHPEIAKRWEKEYSHGGILDINESEEIISDDGNDIELTDYNAAFDEPTGVKSLFRAKDGGRIGLYQGGGPHAGGYGTTSSSSGDKGGYKNVHQTGAVTQTPGRTTSRSTTGGDGPTHPNVHEDETQKSIKDALNEGQRKRDLARIALQTYKPTARKEKIENTPEEKGFWDKLGTLLGVLTFGPVVGIKMPGIVNTLSSVVNTKKNIDKLTTYGINKGWLSEDMTVDKLTEKFIDHTQKQRAKKEEYDSLPSGHPDKIALGIELQIGKTTDEGKSGDEPKPPQIRPIGEEIEEYTEMAQDPMSNWAAMKQKQALNAQLQEKWAAEKEAHEQSFLVANRGGLANLFRVKNQ